MTVGIRDANDSPADQRWIVESYPLYVADLTRGGTGGQAARPSAEVLGEELVSNWFTELSSLVLVILRDGARVGFARVQLEPLPGEQRQVSYLLTDFYVTVNARRRGLGREAANLLFRRFTGAWQVSGSAQDHAATAFWRSVISGHTGGRYTLRRLGGELRHSFFTGPVVT